MRGSLKLGYSIIGESNIFSNFIAVVEVSEPGDGNLLWVEAYSITIIQLLQNLQAKKTRKKKQDTSGPQMPTNNIEGFSRFAVDSN